MCLLVKAYKSRRKGAKIKPAIQRLGGIHNYYSTTHRGQVEVYFSKKYTSQRPAGEGRIRNFMKQNNQGENQKLTSTKFNEIRPLTPGVEFFVPSIYDGHVPDRQAGFCTHGESEKYARKSKLKGITKPAQLLAVPTTSQDSRTYQTRSLWGAISLPEHHQYTHAGEEVFEGDEYEERPKTAVGERHRVRPKAARPRSRHEYIATTTGQIGDERSIKGLSPVASNLSQEDGRVFMDRPKAAVGERHRARPGAARTRILMNSSRPLALDKKEFSDVSLGLGDDCDTSHEYYDRESDRDTSHEYYDRESDRDTSHEHYDRESELNFGRPKAVKKKSGNEHTIPTMSHQKRGEGSEVRPFTPAASVSIGDRGNCLPSHDEDGSEHSRPKAVVDRARPKEAKTRTARPTAKRPRTLSGKRRDCLRHIPLDSESI